MIKEFFLFEGRVNRTQWWQTQIMVGLMAILIAFFVGCGVGILWGTHYRVNAMPLEWSRLIGICMAIGAMESIIWIIAIFANSTKRLHDLGFSGKWLIPVLLFDVIYCVGMPLIVSISLLSKSIFSQKLLYGVLTFLGEHVILGRHIRIVVIIKILFWVAVAVRAITCGFFRGNTEANKYGEPPIQDDAPPTQKKNDESIIKQFFSFKGRINRGQWWKINIIIFLTSFFVTMIWKRIVPNIADFSAIAAIGTVGFIVSTAFLANGVKRFHDLGYSGQWFIPIVLVYIIFFYVAYVAPSVLQDPNVIFLLYSVLELALALCAFFRGNASVNKYDEPPGQNKNELRVKES